MTASPSTTAPATAGAVSALPVASYARRSKRAAGDGKGATINIADQHAQNRAYAAATFPGAPVVEYDDNMSAWNPDKTRDGWERLLEDTRAGQFRAVVGRYADRLTRQPAQGEALLAACRQSRAELHTTSAGQITSALMFRMELALAAEESDQKSRRMNDKHRTLVETGAFSGGRRSFGYGPGMAPVTDNPELAALVAREAEAYAGAFTAVLNGESISSICRAWNAAGLTTTAGNPFTTTVVSRMLRRRYVLGVRTMDGKDVPAAWPAIVPAATFAAAQRRLAERARKHTGNTWTGARVYPLSGVLVCAGCGDGMYAKPTHMKSGHAYICLRRAGHGQAPADKVWRIVRAAVVRRLTRVDAAGAFVVEADRDAAEARQAERMALTARRDEELPDAAALGDYTPAQVKRMTATINARLAELGAADDAETDAASLPARVLAGLVGLSLTETAAAFDALTMDRQRAVIGVLGTPFLIRDPSPRHGVFNPDRVCISWRDGGLDDAGTEDVA